jgi:predicted lipoprotein with Yx(FWY)xxD motif
MFDSGRRQDRAPRTTGRRVRLAGRVGMAALALAVSIASTALATGGTLTLSSASNSELREQVVVNAQGRTLYVLSPETATHLLCKSSECLKLWPPVTVHSTRVKLRAGAGVHGHLGILRRSGGLLQVTLRGMPVYRYAGDESKGEANGQGIESFGGIWHAVRPTASSTPPKASMPSSTSATPPPEYGY